MRRADEDQDAAGPSGVLIWLAALVFMAMGPAAIVPAGAQGDEPARVDRVGQRVVSRFGGLALRDDRDAVADRKSVV